jgi:hypothetical protein
VSITPRVWLRLMAWTNRRFRRINLPEVDVLMENLDCCRPSLKSDIQNVTVLRSLMIEDRCLPDHKLLLETLTDEQTASGELTAHSLKEMLDFTDEDAYFMYLDLPPSPSKRSPSPPASLGEQSNASTPFPDPNAPDQENVGITISTIQEAYLLSPLKPPEKELFTWSS